MVLFREGINSLQPKIWRIYRNGLLLWAPNTVITLLLPVFILTATGLTVLSAISTHLFLLQLSWILAGGLILFVAFWFDWRPLLASPWFVASLYFLVVILLVYVYAAGPVIRNVRGWLQLGPITLQPVELAKVALILLFAQYFSRRHLKIAQFRVIFVSLSLFAAPFLLTALQPDLGNALILFAIWFGILIASGLPRRKIALAIVALSIVAALGWVYGLKTYQRERITAVFYPEKNALGINYSVIQSKIAIGSAGFWGKGYGQGSQTQLGYLTEPVSDFIFAALIEEWGVPGLIIILGAFSALIVRIAYIGSVADRNFDKLLCIGAIIVFSTQFLLNTGSATGLLPVVGVTFPFVSYGGSSMVANFLILSLVASVKYKL